MSHHLSVTVSPCRTTATWSPHSSCKLPLSLLSMSRSFCTVYTAFSVGMHCKLCVSANNTCQWADFTNMAGSSAGERSPGGSLPPDSRWEGASHLLELGGRLSRESEQRRACSHHQNGSHNRCIIGSGRCGRTIVHLMLVNH